MKTAVCIVWYVRHWQCL